MRKFLLLVPLLVTFISYTQAQMFEFGRNWEAGCYYDINGNKTCGLISEYIRVHSFLDGEKHFLFKQDKDSKHVKIYAKNTKAFVVGKDSFVVSNAQILNNTPYLQVLLNTQLKLFTARLLLESPPAMDMRGGTFRKSMTSNFSYANLAYTKNIYYYGANQDDIVEIKRINFIDAMSKLMADKPNVVEKIKNKTYRFGDIDDLIFFYLTGIDQLTRPAYNPNEHRNDY